MACYQKLEAGWLEKRAHSCLCEFLVLPLQTFQIVKLADNNLPVVTCILYKYEALRGVISLKQPGLPQPLVQWFLRNTFP